MDLEGMRARIEDVAEALRMIAAELEELDAYHHSAGAIVASDNRAEGYEDAAQALYDNLYGGVAMGAATQKELQRGIRHLSGAIAYGEEVGIGKGVLADSREVLAIAQEATTASGV